MVEVVLNCLRGVVVGWDIVVEVESCFFSDEFELGLCGIFDVFFRLEGQVFIVEVFWCGGGFSRSLCVLGEGCKVDEGFKE